ISYLPTLLGDQQSEKHDFIVVNNMRREMGRSALITQDGWKLVEVDRDEDLFQLYNVRRDNRERYNLEREFPERVDVLKRQLIGQLNSTRTDL
ncbi:MAG: arylsulfatase, partial [Planctomycetota bacterium]